MKSIYVKLCFVFLVIFNSFAFANKQECPQSYIYTGYNIILGNPDPTASDEAQTDRGWRSNILVEGNDNCITCLYALACNGTYTKEELFAEVDYYNELELKGSLYYEEDDFFYNMQFTGSAEYYTQRQDVFGAGLISIQAEASCQLYTNRRTTGCSAVQFTTGFAEAVKYFPVSTQAPGWYEIVEEFFENFGTHYASSISLGARWSHDSIFTEKSYQGFREANIDIELAAILSAEYWRTNGASGEGESEEQYQLRVLYEDASEEQTAMYVGPKPPVDGDLDDWDQYINEPMPQTYELALLSDFFESRYFPDDPMINAKRRVLNEAYLIYCDNTPGCHEIPKIKHVSAIQDGIFETNNSTSASCYDPDNDLLGYHLLSGGCKSEQVREPLAWYINRTDIFNDEFFCSVNMDHPAGTDNMNTYNGLTATATCIPDRYVAETYNNFCYGLSDPFHSSCVAQCPVGFDVIGGDCYGGGSWPWKVYNTRLSVQAGIGPSWSCGVTPNFGSSTGNVYAFADIFCAKFAPDTVEHVFTRTTPSGTEGEFTNQAIAMCDIGYEVAAGGCEVPYSSYGSWKIIENHVSKNQLGWSCVGQQDMGTGTTHQNVTAHAVCVKFK